MNLRLDPSSRRCAALFVLTLGLHAEAAAAATAAEESMPPRKVALTTSLVTPFFGAYLLEGTARVSDTFGLLANASYLSIENPKDDAWVAHSGTLGAGLDYYLLPKAVPRLYLEAIGELVLASWHHEPSDQVAPITLGYTALALVGYRYIWRSGPVLDVGAGVVTIHFPSARIELDDGGSASSGAFTNVYPALKLNVGWAF